MSAPASSADARRQRRPPSLREHWRDLRERPAAWLVIARNLVPAVGVFAFGWSRSLVIFELWFDGLVGLAAILTAIVPSAVRDTRKPEDSLAKLAAGAVAAWLVMVVFVCLPYWIVLIPLHDHLLDPEMWRQIRASPALWATFAGLAATHGIAAYRKGYGDLPERQMKQALRWDAYLLILRAMGMFVLAANLPAVVVLPAFMLLASYLELWPAYALGAVWGDPSRLFEDPAGSSSGDSRPRPGLSSPPRWQRSSKQRPPPSTSPLSPTSTTSRRRRGRG